MAMLSAFSNLQLRYVQAPSSTRPCFTGMLRDVHSQSSQSSTSLSSEREAVEPWENRLQVPL